ncbi:MarR family winged helix-turn-helix transcriptional regulator [Streptomyces griseocarneus]|uniref:MarR family winged helix-turn-helix transcriptional regulator n=1 Tax=Streptomyces griseocarneus TaxID=51201 RepID=UPI00167CFC1B|nr:MarR family transcriptional regulator [Streptomyces griseocarneus]MBZ6474130.1 MarR family transcriptional regulator [Streptomyces griseocarneus]GHG52246.1 MarR family transcriptional regulator [Streptomyces griseocarneus]
MPSQRPGNALPFLLLNAFRVLIDELHARLAELGHPDLRPAHGIAMQMISRGGSISDLGRRLGVSKQAASKTVTGLEKLGYAQRRPSLIDQRQTEVALTPRGVEALTLSGDILNELRDEWAATVGDREMSTVEDVLARLGGPDSLDRFVGWLGA